MPKGVCSGKFPACNTNLELLWRRLLAVPSLILLQRLPVRSIALFQHLELIFFASCGERSSVSIHCQDHICLQGSFNHSAHSSFHGHTLRLICCLVCFGSLTEAIRGIRSLIWTRDVSGLVVHSLTKRLLYIWLRLVGIPVPDSEDNPRHYGNHTKYRRKYDLKVDSLFRAKSAVAATSTCPNGSGCCGSTFASHAAACLRACQR
jgi:hypothetical protein